MDDVIFALDIGTRSVVGVVGQNIDGCLKITKVESVFHNQRAMVDGQIEDINKVSRVVSEVKAKLEDSLEIKLDKVCIAAAGRSLKTERVVAERASDIRVPITEDFKKAVETEALQLAQEIFTKGSDSGSMFYCVGYSVLCYQLDGKNILNPVGHRSNIISVEIIAAFLPHTVIESLYACMDNNNLEVVNLTLEPIAAMDLIIPSELRLLNLALVDIGAGTSDIAISKNGSVVGYDMATIAGDEITECIMKNYLVDFNAAENIKTMLGESSETICIKSILGFSQDIKKDEILETIKPSIYELCSDIASKIIKLNKESPAAVFLAGGGSKIPFMKEFLAEILNIPSSRIALSEKSTIRDVDLSLIDDFGPELITPVGIAYSVILNKNYDFFSVSVNDVKVRLYSIRQMKVMDAILMSGFDSKKLIGFSGKSLRFSLNGKEMFYSGEFSTPAQIYVNSSVANIETIIHPGDIINVVPAIDGKSPVVKISDIAEKQQAGYAYFNGVTVEFGTRYLVNNVEVTEDYVIGNSDSIEILQIKTLEDIINFYEIDSSFCTFFVNGNKADLNFQLYNNCTIDVSQMKSESFDLNKMKEKKVENETGKSENYENSDISDEDESSDEYYEELEEPESYGSEIINSVLISETSITNEVKESHEGKPSIEKNEIINHENTITVTINNKVFMLPAKDDNSPYIFADMLNYTDIDPSNPKGNIILLHNGRNASYLDLITDKDSVVIKWDVDL